MTILPHPPSIPFAPHGNSVLSNILSSILYISDTYTRRLLGFPINIITHPGYISWLSALSKYMFLFTIILAYSLFITLLAPPPWS